jgi:uroporphyrinogen decarboxylase
VASEAEYLRFGKRFDLEFFAGLKGRTRFDLLHVHGEDVMFDILADYPVNLVNWHDRLTAPTLGEALKRFPKLLVGGLEENRTLTRGPIDSIQAEVRDAVAQTGGRRLMIGPGCVLLVATPEAHIRAAVDAARAK